MGKAIKIAATVIAALWIALCIFNVWQTKNLREPFLAFPSVTDADGNKLWLGAGISFTTKGEPPEYMEMYIFGLRIASEGV